MFNGVMQGKGLSRDHRNQGLGGNHGTGPASQLRSQLALPGWSARTSGSGGVVIVGIETVGLTRVQQSRMATG